MLTFSNLGSLGRLGNQMFQYAAIKGIAEHNKVEFIIPNRTSLHKCFKIPKSFKKLIKLPIVEEKCYEFDSEIFSTGKGDLYGFFQTEKYFSHIEDIIRKDFEFQNKLYNICNHYRINNLPKEVISLHVRRGDYLKDKNFEVLDLDYYLKALDILPDIPVMIFSDDIRWCRKKFLGSKFIFSCSNNPFVDLCLMSLCDYHIIANSSFSWWGSWLAKSKKTIAPNKWFSGDLYSWNTKDLYRKDWVIL